MSTNDSINSETQALSTLDKKGRAFSKSKIGGEIEISSSGKVDRNKFNK
jgi:hypothetical protein